MTNVHEIESGSYVFTLNEYIRYQNHDLFMIINHENKITFVVTEFENTDTYVEIIENVFEQHLISYNDDLITITNYLELRDEFNNAVNRVIIDHKNHCAFVVMNLEFNEKIEESGEILGRRYSRIQEVSF